jgi:hypothetical protein
MAFAIASRALCTSIALLALAPSASAQDNWLLGQILFDNNCSGCHYHTVPPSPLLGRTNRAGYNSDEITDALATVGSMSGISLTTTQVSRIATYLSTPRHASLSPSSDAFAATAIGLLPRATLPFSLRNDGLVSLIASGTETFVDGFRIDAQACATTLAVNATCGVTVEFRPSAAVDYSTTFTVSHNGFGGASSANVSGTGLNNLEVAPLGPVPFTSALNVTSAPVPFAITNRLGSDLRLCLIDSAEFPAPADFNLVGLIYESPTVRCTTLNAPGTPVNLSVTFTPTDGGPRYARFTAQRIGAGGTLLDLQVVELQGNAGPFARFTSTELFSGVRQDINLGATAPPTVLTMTNAGSADLLITARTIPRVAGATADEYFATGCAAGTNLAPGASCDASLTFDPVAIDLRPTNLTFQYGGRSDMIQLRGTGFVGPELQVRNSLGNLMPTNSALGFGRQNVDIVYTQRLTLQNIGSDEALILSAALVSPASASFTLVSPPAPAGCAALIADQTQALAAGASCVVDVRFAPTEAVTYAAQFAVQTRPATSATPPPGVHRINLSGEGANDIPVLLWKDSSTGADLSIVSFPPPATIVGSASPPRTLIRLSNSGPGAAALRLLNLIGTGAASFVIDDTVSNSCSFGDGAPPLLQGGSCDVAVVFSPQSAGTKQAGLQLVSTGSTPQPIQISAQAAGPAVGAAVSIVPAAIEFDAVRVGALSAPVTVTIVSTGSFAATVTGIEADVPFTVQSTTCPAPPFALPPQSSCSMSLTFAPTGDGEATGALRIAVDGRADPLATPLVGDGVAPADLSSGGCSIARTPTVFDPTLWGLSLLAAAAVWYRRRLRQRDCDRQQQRDAA